MLNFEPNLNETTKPSYLYQTIGPNKLRFFQKIVLMDTCVIYWIFLKMWIFKSKKMDGPIKITIGRPQFDLLAMWPIFFGTRTLKSGTQPTKNNINLREMLN